MYRTFTVVVDVEDARPAVVIYDVSKHLVIGRSHEDDVAGNVRAGGRDRSRIAAATGRPTAAGQRRRVDRAAGRDERHCEGPTERGHGVDGQRRRLYEDGEGTARQRRTHWANTMERVTTSPGCLCSHVATGRSDGSMNPAFYFQGPKSVSSQRHQSKKVIGRLNKTH